MLTSGKPKMIGPVALVGQRLLDIGGTQRARTVLGPDQFVYAELALGHSFIPDVIHQILVTSIGSRHVRRVAGPAHEA